MMQGEPPSAEYAAEIRAFLLGRLKRSGHTTGEIEAQLATLPVNPPVLNWWIFEGKRYRGLDRCLARQLPTVHRQARRLAATHNPHLRDLPLPEGDVDWVSTAFLTATSLHPRYVCRTSSIGLSPDEAAALSGWLTWVGQRWGQYVGTLGVPEGSTAEVPWADGTEPPEVDERRLKRWAFVARRSRWPLLRSVVAESLRVVFESQLVDQLPLPKDHSVLFELVCLVRVLLALQTQPRCIRWLDSEIDGNTIRVPGITCSFQHYIEPERMLSSSEFDHSGLREAYTRHRVRMPAYVDGLIEFDEPRRGFRGIVIEAKSGSQGYDAAVHQLKCYRAALRDRVPGPVVLLGVVEQGSLQECEAELASLSTDPYGDAWVFCPAVGLPAAIRKLGLEQDPQEAP